MRKIILTVTAILMLAWVYPANATLLVDYHLDIYDGDIYDEVFVGDPGSVDMYGGIISVKLEFRQSTTGNIYGGQLDWLWTDDNSVVNIYGGTLNVLASRPDSTVYLYAYDTVYHQDGGYCNNPWIEGKYLSDNNPFSFNFYGETSVPQLVIVPEPTTFLLFALAGLFLRG